MKMISLLNEAPNKTHMTEEEFEQLSWLLKQFESKYLPPEDECDGCGMPIPSSEACAINETYLYVRDIMCCREGLPGFTR
jgi:hypothetical protein